MNVKELFDRIADVNPERLEAYQRMFDRILLYTIAANVIPQDHIVPLLKNADKIIKKTIDVDSNKQTTFLHESKEGREARLESQHSDNRYDGEAVRLEFLKTWELVKEIVKANITRPDNSDSDSDSKTEY